MLELTDPPMHPEGARPGPPGIAEGAVEDRCRPAGGPTAPGPPEPAARPAPGGRAPLNPVAETAAGPASGLVPVSGLPTVAIAYEAGPARTASKAASAATRLLVRVRTRVPVRNPRWGSMSAALASRESARSSGASHGRKPPVRPSSDAERAALPITASERPAAQPAERLERSHNSTRPPAARTATAGASAAV